MALTCGCGGQTVGAMEGTSVSVTALPLLNRKEDCLASFLKVRATGQHGHGWWR